MPYALEVAATRILLAIMLATSAWAQSLPYVYRRSLQMFDNDHGRLSAEFEGFAEADKPRLEGYLVRLQNHLKKIPTNFHSSPEYQQRDTQFQALKAKLEGGAPPAAAAVAPVVAPPATMAAPAATPAKSDLQMAREFQAQYKALNSELSAAPRSVFSDAAKVASYRARFAELKAIVDGYRDMTKPWAKQTKASYDSYSSWFEGEVAKDAAAAARDAAASSGGPVFDFVAQKAADFFDADYDRYIGDFARVTPSNQADLKRYLERLENRLSKFPEASRGHPEVVARAGKLAKLREGFEAGTAALAAEASAAASAAAAAASAAAAAGPMTPAELDYSAQRAVNFYDKQRSRYASDFKDLTETDAKVLLGYVTKLEGHLEKVAPPFRDHPEVASRRQALAELRARIDGQAIEQAKMGESIAEQLGLLQQLFPFRTFDPSLADDASPEDTRKWAERLQDWSKAYDDGKAFLAKAARHPKLKDDRDFKVYKTWFPQVRTRIDNEVEDSRRDWEANVRGALMNLGVKPEAMSESSARAFAASLQGVLPDYDRLLAFQRAYDGKLDPEYATKRGQLDDVIAKLLGSANTRVERARMMKPTVAQTPELLERARGILALPKYGFEEIRGLRVTSLPQRQTQVEYFDGTWYTKDWDEYQVTFAHKDPKQGGKWFVAYGNLRFYRKAWRTTTQNEWILSSSWNSEEILPQNID